MRDYWVGLKMRRDRILERSERVTLVLPGRLNEWFLRPGAILSAKSEPSSRAVPDPSALKILWAEFLQSWEHKKALFRFDPQDEVVERKGRQEAGDLEALVRRDFRTPPECPLLNDLPDVWVGLSREVVASMVGGENIAPRDLVAEAFIRMVETIYKEKQAERKRDKGATLPIRSRDIRKWLEGGDLRVIRVSNASSNPRFLGERIWSLEDSIDLLVHSALALSKADQCTSEGDFARGWPVRAD